LKVFTIDNRFIARRIGTLEAADQATVSARVREALPVFAGSK
jgi:hypothetical protein